MDDYLTVKEAAEKWGVSCRAVTYQIADGRIPGVVRKGNMWLLPQDAAKPVDLRRKRNKEGGRHEADGNVKEKP